MTTLQKRLRNDFVLFANVHWQDQNKTAREAADAIDELVEVLDGVGRTVSPQQFAHAQRLIAKYKARP